MSGPSPPASLTQPSSCSRGSPETQKHLEVFFIRAEEGKKERKEARRSSSRGRASLSYLANLSQPGLHETMSERGTWPDSAGSSCPAPPIPWKTLCPDPIPCLCILHSLCTPNLPPEYRSLLTPSLPPTLTMSTWPQIIRLRFWVNVLTKSTSAGRKLGGPVSTRHWGLGKEGTQRGSQERALRAFMLKVGTPVLLIPDGPG